MMPLPLLRNKLSGTKRKIQPSSATQRRVREVALAPPEDGAIPVKIKKAEKAVASKNGNGSARKAVAMLVHSFPSETPGGAAPGSYERWSCYAPYVFEEAVKEAAFRDREVFVFRDHEGQALVLHRKRDGKMELIEVP